MNAIHIHRIVSNAPCDHRLAHTMFSRLRWMAAVALLAGMPALAQQATFAHTQFPTDVRQSSAILNGMAVPNGLPSTAWFEWSEIGGVNHVTGYTTLGNGTNVIRVSAPVGNLEPGGRYECRLVVSNAAGITPGAVHWFTTGRRVVAWGLDTFGTNAAPELASITNAVLVADRLALRADGTVAAWADRAGKVPAGLSEVVQVSGNQQLSMALKSDGSVVQWGVVSIVPPGLRNVVAVAAGLYHSLALRADGTVVGWGQNSAGEASVPAGFRNVVAIAAGSHQSLALKGDGTVVAWGDVAYGLSNVPPGLSNVVAISCGWIHNFALRRDGTVVAWGNNAYGQVSVPNGLSNVVAIAAGGYHNLALLMDGTTVAWGGNTYGQTNSPAGLTDVIAIAASGSRSLAIAGNVPPQALTVEATGPANQDLKVALKAVDPNGDPVGYRITSLPTAGSLHQCDGETRGAAITASGAAVTDAQGRVIFAPDSNAVAHPYATFEFTATDGSAELPPATATLNIGTLRAFTQPAMGIRPTTATLSGMASADGLTAAAWFEWGERWGAWQATAPVATSAGQDLVHVSVPLTGLRPSQSYQCRLVVSNAVGLRRGAVQWFITGGRPYGWGDSSGLPMPGDLTNAVAVASGGYYPHLALRADGTLAAWGNSTSGELPPPGLENVIAIPGGGTVSLALRDDGTVVTWGRNPSGKTNVPPGLANVVAIAGGGSVALALRADGTVAGWGALASGETNQLQALRRVVAVAVGIEHRLALRIDGTVVAWGGSSLGQTDVPPGLTNVVAISAGGYHSLALREDGSLVAWGLNDYGQTNRYSPKAKPIAIAAGYRHNLVLTETGRAEMWGQISQSDMSILSSLTNLAAIAAGAGGAYNVVIRQDAAPHAESQSVSGAVDRDLVITLQSSDADYDLRTHRVISLPAVGRLYQFEGGARGQAITGVDTLVSDPYLRLIFAPEPGAFGDPYASFAFVANDGMVDSAPASVAVSIGRLHAFTLPPTSIRPDRVTLNGAIQANGLAGWSWFEWRLPGADWQTTIPVLFGNSDSLIRTSAEITGLQAASAGQCRLVVSNATGLIRGFTQRFTTGNRVTAWGSAYGGAATLPAGLTNAVAVAGGRDHALALRNDGTVMAWGTNTYGQRTVPVGLTNVVAVAAGGSYSLALRADGTFESWGRNIAALGAMPVGLSNVVAVAAGDSHGLALRADGTVVAWGDNSYGQTNVPGNLRNVVAVAAGVNFSLALRADGTVAVWGLFWTGSNNVANYVPADLRDVVAIDAGSYHCLALRSNGTVVVWGYYAASVLTNTASLSNVVALSGGTDHSMALREDGTVAAWGYTSAGQTTVPHGLTNVVAVECGARLSLAIADNLPPESQSLVVSGAANRDLIVTLRGKDLNGDALSFRITSLPLVGQLYQFDNGLRGAAISQSDTLVADAGGRLVFVPEQSGVGNPYTAFGYVVNDGVTDSAVSPVTIHIGAPRAFTQAATRIRPTSAVLNGMTLANGIASSAWFEWGERWGSWLATAPIEIGDGVSVSHVNANVTGLVEGGVYQCRLVVSNAAGLARGAVQWFTTGSRVTVWGEYPTGSNPYPRAYVPPGLTNIVAVTAGVDCSFALRSDGRVAVWGTNYWMQRGEHTNLSDVVALATGGRFGRTDRCFALLGDGTIAGWGSASYFTNVPSGLSNVVALAVCAETNVALRADGTVAVWGSGALSVGSFPGLSNVVGIAAGDYHFLALRADGTVTAVGYSIYGETNVPSGLDEVVAVVAQERTSAAIKADGTTVWWGKGPYPAGMSNTLSLALGFSHVIGLRDDGTLRVSEFSSRSHNQPPAGLSNVVAVAAGGYHSLALGNLAPQALSQSVTGFPNRDLVIELRGFDTNADALSFWVTALSATGTLYQYDAGRRGAEITGVNPFVNDPAGRIIFAPAADDFLSPYSSFAFAATDGLASSVPAEVVVSIALPPAPQLAGGGWRPDGAFVVSFAGHPNASYHLWASTNLIDWELIGVASMPRPGMFEAVDPRAAESPQRFYRASAP